MSDKVYLGRVKGVYENIEKKYRHATVEPLVESTEDQKRWLGCIENPIEEFPARGFVNWHDAPKGLEVGDIRQFDVECHPFYKGEPDKEEFQVRTHKYPMEIIDLRNIGSEREIRILLTTTGVFLNDRPLVEQCVLWVQDEKWVGPVDLMRQSASSSWVVAPTQNLDSIRCTKIPPGAIQQVELDGMRYLLAPNQDNLGQHIGFVNWETDEVLAKRVYGRLWKHDRKTAEALKISKDVFKTYVETIEQAGLIGSHSMPELAFHDRIKDIIDVISRNEELLDEAANVCFAIGPVKEKIEEKAEEEYRRKLSEHEIRLDEDLANKKAKLKTVVENLSRKEDELSSEEKRLQSLNEELEKRVSGFETELEERLYDLAEKPERLFAEMAIAKALVSRPGSTHTKQRVAVCRLIGDLDPNIPIVNEASVLMGAISKRLLGLRISPVVGQMLHSSLLAGLVPVLIGSEAHNVVSAYADCVSGGSLLWIPVGGSIFEPSDLLARFDPISRSLIPHPGGLLDILLDESDAMHVVVLDGFNRAAVDGYLVPLLRSLQDVTQGKEPRSIPLAPPGFVDKDDAYAGVSRLAWNRNVLLVLCPSFGTSTLPVPVEFWDHCTVLYVDDTAPVGIPLEPGDNHRMRLPATVWKAWSEGAKEKSEQLEVLWNQPIEVDTLPRIILGNVERICGSGTVLGLKHESALELAIKTTLFPYLVAAEERVDVWFQHLKVALSESDRKIEDAIKRLGE